MNCFHKQFKNDSAVVLSGQFMSHGNLISLRYLTLKSKQMSSDGRRIVGVDWTLVATCILFAFTAKRLGNIFEKYFVTYWLKCCCTEAVSKRK